MLLRLTSFASTSKCMMKVSPGTNVSNDPIERTSANTFSNWHSPAVALLAIPIPILVFATIVILRRGFPVPTVGLLKMTGVALLIINAGGVEIISTKRWFLCPPILSVMTLVGVIVLGLSPLGVYPPAVIVMAAAGGLAALWNVFRAVRSFGPGRTIALILLGALLGVYAESMYFRINAAHHILYREAILAGQAQNDVLEQSAIVEMIATHGVAFTGIDGIVPMKYHTGSLWMAEGLRRLCRLSAIDAVAFGDGILLIPFYVAALFGCAEMLRAAVGSDLRLLSPTLFAASAVVLIGIFPFVNDPIHLNFNEMIINSDSYLLASAMSLQLVAGAVQFYIYLRSRKRQMTPTDKIAALLLVPATLALLGFVKISQMYLLVALLLYLCWRLRWMRAWPLLSGTAFSFVLLLYMLHAEVGATRSDFALFRFDRVHPEWVPYFFLLYFAWPWLLLVLWARRERVVTISEFGLALRDERTIPLEVVLAAIVAGLVPYMLIDFHAPNWKFFLQFQGILAGLLVAAFLPEAKPREWLRQIRDGSFRLQGALAFVLLFAIVGHLFMTITGSFSRLLKANGTVRAILEGAPDTAWPHELRQIRNGRASIVGLAAQRLSLEQCLSALHQEPEAQRRKTALYIPKTDRLYWDMRQFGLGSTPFIAPAFSGITMVKGLPEFDDLGWVAFGWGYPQYKLPTRPEPPSDITSEAIVKAGAEGFQELLVLTSAPSQSCQIRSIELGRTKD